METCGTMGDATVFPTETIVILAASLVALIEAREHDSDVNTRMIYVFGDDICIQNRASVHEAMHRVFSALGFKINDEKSFFSGPYRESCGVEAYRGYEIQPWYLLNRKEFPSDRAQLHAVLVAAANHAYWHGFKCCRWAILRQLAPLCKGIKLIPFTEYATDNAKVFTPFLSDRGIYRRNSDTFERQRRCLVTVSREEDDLYEEELEQWYRYYTYLLNPPVRESFDDDVTRSFLNRALHIRGVWTDVRLLEV
jgi:hypothetical protein